MLVNFTGFLFVACTLNKQSYFIEVRNRGEEGPGGRRDASLVPRPNPTQPSPRKESWQGGRLDTRLSDAAMCSASDFAQEEKEEERGNVCCMHKYYCQS